MPFSHRSKELLGGGASLRLFAYSTTDLTKDVIEKDYFRYWSEIEVNDFIMVKCADSAFIAVVRSKNPTVIEPPDNPWDDEGGDQPIKTLGKLRKTAKELGINSYGMGIKELSEAIANKSAGVKL